MKWLKIFAALLLSLPLASEACTGIKLKAKDGNSVSGRTVEFGLELHPSIAFIPRKYPFVGSTPLGNGLQYQSKYAAIGTICFDQLAIMDGINEKGLAVGAFYFPTFAGYTPTTAANQRKSLSPVDFTNWILTQFASIDELKNELSNVFIAPTVIKNWGEAPPPFHYIVYDRDGKSLVIEPIEGKLVLYDNPIGVITNSPTFEWQMTNLRNYINLSTLNAPPLKIDNLILKPFGEGSGLHGLPGDFTPPSRFVRATIFSTFAELPKNVDEAVFQAFHILNQFDIPIGAAKTIKNGTVLTDYTQLTSVHDPIHLRYYFRTYDDQNIQMADLNAIEKDSPQAIKFSTAGKQTYTNIFKELEPPKKPISPSE